MKKRAPREVESMARALARRFDTPESESVVKYLGRGVYEILVYPMSAEIEGGRDDGARVTPTHWHYDMAYIFKKLTSVRMHFQSCLERVPEVLVWGFLGKIKVLVRVLSQSPEDVEPSGLIDAKTEQWRSKEC